VLINEFVEDDRIHGYAANDRSNGNTDDDSMAGGS
jgi:hypothetical protein